MHCKKTELLCSVRQSMQTQSHFRIKNLASASYQTNTNLVYITSNIIIHGSPNAVAIINYKYNL
jgi:hypothetical protein